MSIQENKKILVPIIVVAIVISASATFMLFINSPSDNGNNGTGDTMVTDISALGEFSTIIYGFYQHDIFQELGRTSTDGETVRLSQYINSEMNFTINVDGDIQHSIQIFRGERTIFVYFGISFNVINDGFA